MKSSRIAVLLLAVAAVIAVAVLAGHRGGGSSSSSGPAAAANAIRVSFDYSPEKEILLRPLIDRFNRERVQVQGRPVFVDGTAASSGDDEAKLARKQLEITAWSPASSLWGRLLD